LFCPIYKISSSNYDWLGVICFTYIHIDLATSLTPTSSCMYIMRLYFIFVYITFPFSLVKTESFKTIHFSELKIWIHFEANSCCFSWLQVSKDKLWMDLESTEGAILETNRRKKERKKWIVRKRQRKKEKEKETEKDRIRERNELQERDKERKKKRKKWIVRKRHRKKEKEKEMNCQKETKKESKKKRKNKFAFSKARCSSRESCRCSGSSRSNRCCDIVSGQTRKFSKPTNDQTICTYALGTYVGTYIGTYLGRQLFLPFCFDYQVSKRYYIISTSPH
jgi:hypothetical protein